jgi:TM2 domain-containing membrane protein YozV
MPVQDDVYTIVEPDVAPRRGRVTPDWRPSASVRGPHAPEGSRPLIASSLSMFLPGAGQAYNGQRQLGLLLFLVQGMAAAAHWGVAQRWSDLVELGSLFGWNEWQIFRALAVADVVILLVFLVGVYQAYRRAEHDVGGYDGMNQPMVSGLASLLLPGWGQIMNGQVGKGLVFLSGLLGGLYVMGFLMLTPVVRLMDQADPTHELLSRATTLAIGVLSAGVLLWVLSVYDAVLVAGYRRQMS